MKRMAHFWRPYCRKIMWQKQMGKSKGWECLYSTCETSVAFDPGGKRNVLCFVLSDTETSSAWFRFMAFVLLHFVLMLWPSICASVVLLLGSHQLRFHPELMCSCRSLRHSCCWNCFWENTQVTALLPVSCVWPTVAPGGYQWIWVRGSRDFLFVA